MSDFFIKTFDVMRSYYSVMDSDDLRDVALSFSTTVVLGALMIFIFYGIYRFHNQHHINNIKIKKTSKKNKDVVGDDAKKNNEINTKEEAENDYCEGNRENKKVDNNTPMLKRYIPLEEQKVIMERAKKQLREGHPDKALISFLFLLYASVESNNDNALPSQLTECLRGASECYQMLGQPENAVKFLQAERRVFEEVVAIAASTRDPGRGRESILQALFQPSSRGWENTTDIPKRCDTLFQVAHACTRLGRHDVALAYHVKAAAVKYKITGKPLDMSSSEAQSLAEAVRNLQLMPDGHEVAKRALLENTVYSAGESAVVVEDPLVMHLKERANISGVSPEQGSGVGVPSETSAMCA